MIVGTLAYYRVFECERLEPSETQLAPPWGWFFPYRKHLFPGGYKSKECSIAICFPLLHALEPVIPRSTSQSCRDAESSCQGLQWTRSSRISIYSAGNCCNLSLTAHGATLYSLHVSLELYARKRLMRRALRLTQVVSWLWLVFLFISVPPTNTPPP